MWKKRNYFYNRFHADNGPKLIFFFKLSSTDFENVKLSVGSKMGNVKIYFLEQVKVEQVFNEQDQDFHDLKNLQDLEEKVLQSIKRI